LKFNSEDINMGIMVKTNRKMTEAEALECIKELRQRLTDGGTLKHIPMEVYEYADKSTSKRT